VVFEHFRIERLGVGVVFSSITIGILSIEYVSLRDVPGSETGS